MSANKFVAIVADVSVPAGFHVTVFVAALFHEPVAVPTRKIWPSGDCCVGESAGEVDPSFLGIAETTLIVSRISPSSDGPRKNFFSAMAR